MNKIDNCLCCGNNNLKLILDLGLQPLANSYHQGEVLDRYPLELQVCQDCWHLQLTYAIDPDLMFKEYLYVSGTSKTLNSYFKWFVEFTLNYYSEAKTVLDIACNDGTQLDYFKNKELSTYGIDPALNLLPSSTGKGHTVIGEYFNKKSALKLKESKFDIIIAQNVFAHNTYPLEFLNTCKSILSDKGHIFIQTSQANMVRNNEFDTIYHEHISFFNIVSMQTLVDKSGLYLNDVIKTDVHGTSYVYVLSKNNKQTVNIQNELKIFTDSKLNELKTYLKYAEKSYSIVEKLKSRILKFKEEGHTVIGYGAAAKGNTLLNFGNIKLDLIIDDNPLKHNLLTPGMDIPIRPLESLKKLDPNKPVVFIPLAWNFYTEIKDNIKTIRKGNDVFIKYFPELIIE